MSSLLSHLFPRAPTFKPEHLPSLAGKVFIITGAASGVGFELAKILYVAGGSVYIAARSISRCSEAIEKIRITAEGKNAAERKAGGKLGSMVVDLANLATVRGAVEEFLKSEVRLDGLVHNAGVMTPPAGSKDKLGHDLEMGVHCLAPYLLTRFLEPILLKTAESAAPYSVRIVWVVSLMSYNAPKDGMSFAVDGTPNVLTKPMENYMQSKVGGSWLAAEFAKQLGSKGILSVGLHPGFITTELQRHMPSIARFITGVVFKPPIYGAYSELYAVLSPDLKAEHNGGYLVAWGRVGEMEKSIANGLKSKLEGGTGAAETFMQYCNREIEHFL